MPIKFLASSANLPRRRFWMFQNIQSRHHQVWRCVVFYQRIGLKIYSKNRLDVLEGPDMRRHPACIRQLDNCILNALYPEHV
jgi:hypothetical protein